MRHFIFNERSLTEACIEIDVVLGNCTAELNEDLVETWKGIK